MPRVDVHHGTISNGRDLFGFATAWQCVQQSSLPGMAVYVQRSGVLRRSLAWHVARPRHCVTGARGGWGVWLMSVPPIGNDSRRSARRFASRVAI